MAQLAELLRKGYEDVVEEPLKSGHGSPHSVDFNHPSLRIVGDHDAEDGDALAAFDDREGVTSLEPINRRGSMDELEDEDEDENENEDKDEAEAEAEDTDDEIGDVEAFHHDDLDTGSKLQKTKRYKDIVMPRVPQVSVALEPHHKTIPIGVVSSVLGACLVIEGMEGTPPLNEGSILWLTELRSPLGIIDEIFGPVKKPFYVVKYNDIGEIPEGAKEGANVSYVLEYADFVLNNLDLFKKGYDASVENGEELSDDEFSDDEKEAEYKRSKAQKKRTNSVKNPVASERQRSHSWEGKHGWRDDRKNRTPKHSQAMHNNQNEQFEGHAVGRFERTLDFPKEASLSQEWPSSVSSRHTCSPRKSLVLHNNQNEQGHRVGSFERTLDFLKEPSLSHKALPFPMSSRHTCGRRKSLVSAHGAASSQKALGIPNSGLQQTMKGTSCEMRGPRQHLDDCFHHETFSQEIVCSSPSQQGMQASSAFDMAFAAPCATRHEVPSQDVLSPGHSRQSLQAFPHACHEVSSQQFLNLGSVQQSGEGVPPLCIQQPSHSHHKTHFQPISALGFSPPIDQRAPRSRVPLTNQRAPQIPGCSSDHQTLPPGFQASEISGCSSDHQTLPPGFAPPTCQKNPLQEHTNLGQPNVEGQATLGPPARIEVPFGNQNEILDGPPGFQVCIPAIGVPVPPPVPGVPVVPTTSTGGNYVPSVSFGQGGSSVPSFSQAASSGASFNLAGLHVSVPVEQLAALSMPRGQAQQAYSTQPLPGFNEQRQPRSPQYTNWRHGPHRSRSRFRW